LLYPDKLTRSFQIELGIGVLVVNMVIYGGILRLERKRRSVLGK